MGEFLSCLVPGSSRYATRMDLPLVRAPLSRHMKVALNSLRSCWATSHAFLRTVRILTLHGQADIGEEAAALVRLLALDQFTITSFLRSADDLTLARASRLAGVEQGVPVRTTAAAARWVSAGQPRAFVIGLTNPCFDSAHCAAGRRPRCANSCASSAVSKTCGCRRRSASAAPSFRRMNAPVV